MRVRANPDANPILTPQRVGERELAARAAAAEAAEAAEEKARGPQHLLSPAALRLLDPSLDGGSAQARYGAGVRGTDDRGRPYHEQVC